MKALVLNGIKQLAIEDLEQPKPQDDEVLVKIAYAGICGTDKHLYGGLPGSAPAEPPIVLGHENSGTVAAIGKNVTNVKVGDRVAIDPNIYKDDDFYTRTGRPELSDGLSAVGVTRDGGFEEYTTAPSSVVYSIPENVSFKAAAMIEPISCVIHGINLIKLTPYQKALVIGDGFIGQLFVQALQCYGVHQVDAAGISDEKLKKMKELGAVETFNTLKDDIKSGYDIVVEAVGLPATQKAAIEMAAKGGQVLMFGVGKPDQTFEINTYEIFQKQLTIQGSFINPFAFEDSIALLQSGNIEAESLISHELSLEEVEDCLEGKIENVNKAVVKVSD